MDGRSCCLLSTSPKGCKTKPYGFMIDIDSYVILVNILFPKARSHLFFSFLSSERGCLLSFVLSRLSESMHFGIQITFLIASFRVRFVVNNVS